MKKILKINLVLFLLISIGCSKDITNVDEYKSVDLNSMFSSSKQSAASIENVTTFNDILRFKTEDDFDKARNTLLDMQEAELTEFNNLYLDESKEDFEYLDEIAEEIGFSEENIFEQFNSALNFYSLRNKINEEEAIFLNNENPNWEENPINHFLGTPDMFTLFNSHNEFMIGDKIYKTYEDGLTLVIDNKDYDAVLELRADREAYANLASVSVFGNESVSGKNSSANKTNGPGCRMNKKEYTSEKYNKSGSQYRANKNVGISDIGLWELAYSRITNYKKIGGNWKQRSTRLETSVTAAIVTFTGCNYAHEKYKSKSGTAKTRYCSHTTWGPYLMQAINKNGCAGTYRANYITLNPVYVNW